jgi:hypothetical protein
LSQELEVGVKWNTQRGWRVSQRITSGVLMLRIPLYEALFVKLLVAPFLLVLIRAVPRLGRFDDHRR